MRNDKVDESDNSNIDIIFTQNLIAQHVMKPSSIVTAEDGGITNFKRFRKVLLLASECINLHHFVLTGVHITV